MIKLPTLLDPELFMQPTEQEFSARSEPSLYQDTFRQFFSILFITQNKFNAIVSSITLSEDTVFIQDQKAFISAWKYTELRNRLIAVLFSDEPSSKSFGQAKFYIDTLFYNLTVSGRVEFEYRKEHLLTTTEAGKILGVTRETINKYLKFGLERIRVKSHNRIPEHALHTWKDNLLAIDIQSLAQKYRYRNQAKNDRLAELQEENDYFEMRYGGTFEEVFVDVLNGKKDADEIGEGLDFEAWKETLEEIKSLVD